MWGAPSGGHRTGDHFKGPAVDHGRHRPRTYDGPPHLRYAVSLDGFGLPVHKSADTLGTPRACTRCLDTAMRALERVKNMSHKDKAGGKKPPSTPESANGLEASKRDNEAVRKAVTAESDATERGTKSVLPGPPIPPEKQAEIRNEKQQPDKGRTAARRGPPGPKR